MCENTAGVCCAHYNCMAGFGEVCTHVETYLNAKDKPNNELAISISHTFCITNCYMYLSNDVFIVIEGV